MNTPIKELMKPSLLNTISGLEFMARIIVEGFIRGSNKSQSIGADQVFSQYRNYQLGDDLRQLDWKMFARTERYYIKEAEIETNITIKFMLDASRSMAYTEGEISKLQYAKVMTAALAYLARKQGDTFGLYSVNDEAIQSVLPRFEQQQFIRFLTELVKVNSKGGWSKSKNMQQLYDHHGKEMIVFLTDLYDQEGDLQKFISQLKTKRNEVIVFHLMGICETEFDFNGSVTFEDLETGLKTKTDSHSQQHDYRTQLNTWLSELQRWMLEKQINYQLVLMNFSVDDVLRNFLTQRKRLMR